MAESRYIIVSNRLPVSIQKTEEEIQVIPSAGGLATGLRSFHKANDSLWIGWPGLSSDSDRERKSITELLSKEQCFPVFLEEDMIDNFYYGFSNTTIWPLFHYFAEFTEFSEKHWEAYRQVNEMFAQVVLEHVGEGDFVWVHDYQLLLLPQMLRENRPDLQIGFFLHIPFPSYEVLRIVPWREQILEGILGADLIGFHTFDYARHFISSVQRLIGFEVDFNTLIMESRHAYIDVFPMSIDYDKFYKKAREVQSKPVQERSKEHQDIDRFLLSAPDRKLILSIDRLDYTKGIPERLRAFKHFLSRHPEFHEKVSLIMLTVPSRENVQKYQELKSEVEELVGSINGEFGTMNWNPVIYFYRAVPFENLVELYSSAEIALLTPLRDGMNLVAKEFVVSRVNKKGVLILSEMTGAAKELGEAILVNPNNVRDVSGAIYKALTMPVEEQEKAIVAMQKRIRRYDVFKWAGEFTRALEQTGERKQQYHTRKVSPKLKEGILNAYRDSNERILFLDYDGTLQRFFDKPQAASPDKELYSLLRAMAKDPANDLVLISGRDKDTLQKWFGDEALTLIAEHGAWIRENGGDWISRKPVNDDWKANIAPVLESYVDRTPGSLIEEKTHSLVWHYRKVDIELGVIRSLELKANVSNLILNQDLEILEGNKVIEIKPTGINKGMAAVEYLQERDWSFLLAIGDDWTDEFLFRELPDDAYTIKVGSGNSVAKYYLQNHVTVRNFLQDLIR
jgi:trehalose 6-phosphate synthase/phosphatase